MILFIAGVYHHAAAGLQVVIEDYVASNAAKLIQITLVKMVFAFMAVASIVSILKISF